MRWFITCHWRFKAGARAGDYREMQIRSKIIPEYFLSIFVTIDKTLYCILSRALSPPPDVVLLSKTLTEEPSTVYDSKSFFPSLTWRSAYTPGQRKQMLLLARRDKCDWVNRGEMRWREGLKRERQGEGEKKKNSETMLSLRSGREPGRERGGMRDKYEERGGLHNTSMWRRALSDAASG